MGLRKRHPDRRDLGLGPSEPRAPAALGEQAVDVAGEEFDETLPHLDAEEEGYGWVKIWDARESGILPLPW